MSSRGYVAAYEGEEGIDYVNWGEYAGLVEGVIVGRSVVAMAAVAAWSLSGDGELAKRGIFAGGSFHNWGNSRIMPGFIVV